MSPDPEQPNPAPRLTHRTAERILWSGIAVWALWLFFQTGHPFDEGEHAHVAWLISQGRVPLRDFFEHHQPVLWDVLRLGFPLGFQGASILIWGRLVVVACGLASLWFLRAFGRSWTEATDRWPPPIAGVVCLMIFSFEMAALFVIRPETLSFPLIFAGLAAWMSPGVRAAFVSGLLCSASAYTSPRMVLLGGLLVIFNRPAQVIRDEVRRWGALAAGGLTFVVLYTAVTGYPLRMVVFNVRFSAYLQTVGQSSHNTPVWAWALIFLSIAAAGVALAGAAPESRRLRGYLALAYAGLLFVPTAISVTTFQYVQQYAAIFATLCVALTYLDAVRERPFRRRQRSASALAVAIVLPTILACFPAVSLRFLDVLQVRRYYGALVPPGESIHVFPQHSPIDVPDSSFYFFDLLESDDRLCRAVDTWPGAAGLPRCDRTRELLAKRPALVEGYLTTSAGDSDRLLEMLETEYVPAAPARQRMPSMMRGVLLRKEIADRLVAQ